jgi:DNA-binding CsgD family transcriptional regulator
LKVNPQAGRRWAGVYAERINAARGHPAELKRLFERSLVPMVMVDDQRRYVDANAAAQSALTLSLAELRSLRLDDLTPPHLMPTVESTWAQMLEAGYVAWPPPLSAADRGYLGVTTYALANALPGQHLIAFAPAGWPDGRMPGESEQTRAETARPLTPREVEVLALAAEGNSRATIARVLLVSPATVRTHFEHIYAKLGVHDRAAAVAQAIRLGVIT